MAALDPLNEHGLTMRIDGDQLVVAPSERLTDELRNYIRANKPTLLDLARTWADLESTIQECCAARGDDDRNLNALMQDCRNEPADSWPGLIWYFNQEAARYNH